VLGVGDEDGAGVDPARGEAGVLQRGGDHATARQLAEGHDRVGRARRDLLDHREGPDDRLELVEEGVDRGEERGAPLRGPDGRRHLLVAPAQRADGVPRPGAVAGLGEPGGGEERVGDPGERGDDDEARPALAGDDPHEPGERLGILHRGAAELHYHGRFTGPARPSP
jgi:hypothetical protein